MELIESGYKWRRKQQAATMRRRNPPGLIPDGTISNLFAGLRVEGMLWAPARWRREVGLTTLGWLLVVAAVSGLAAVAVVLVQRETRSSGELVASYSARQEAAEVATAELMRRWRAEAPESAEDADRLNRELVARCRRIGILYADIDLEVAAKAGVYEVGGVGWSENGLPVCVLV